MNTHLPVLFLSAILIAGIGVTPSFAQVDQITVITDKESYSAGETIIVSGEVSQRLSGQDITMRVTAANGNLVTINQISVGQDRQYSIELTAGGKLWSSSGQYTINVLYGSQARTNTTTFEFGGDSGSSTDVDTGQDVDQGSPMQTFTVDAGEGGTFSVGYSITGGSVNGITVNGDTRSLTVSIDATDDGELTLTLPRNAIDSKVVNDGDQLPVCEGADDDFYVLVDFEELDITETKTDANRTVTIPFFAGSEEIEIIGSCAVPEFGTIAALILAVAIISIIAVSARSRLSIMPKY